jgi:hypothetical protein
VPSLPSTGSLAAVLSDLGANHLNVERAIEGWQHSLGGLPARALTFRQAGSDPRYTPHLGPRSRPASPAWQSRWSLIWTQCVRDRPPSIHTRKMKSGDGKNCGTLEIEVHDTRRRQARKREAARRWRHSHPEVVRAKKRRYHEKHKAELTEQCRKYDAKHSDERRARARAYYGKNSMGPILAKPPLLRVLCAAARLRKSTI